MLIYERGWLWLLLIGVRWLLCAWSWRSAWGCVLWDTSYARWDRSWVSCTPRRLPPWGIYQWVISISRLFPNRGAWFFWVHCSCAARGWCSWWYAWWWEGRIHRWPCIWLILWLLQLSIRGCRWRCGPWAPRGWARSSMASGKKCTRSYQTIMC